MAKPPFRVTPATLDVMEALLGPDDELYGLRIAQNAKRKTGSVYPILLRLEETGWVESFWETPEQSARGPRRRFYRLTPDGLGRARALLVEHRGVARQRTSAAPSTSSWRPAPDWGGHG
jgi:PadR family transcriptional regulator PadR